MTKKIKTRKIIIAIGTIIATGILSLSIMILGITSYYSKDLPDYRQLANYTPPTTTRLYANNGNLLEEYAIEKRLFVPIGAMPKRLINAFIAAEDKNFYNHPGIDFISIIRAGVKNLMNLGQKKPLAGGSTITQQVVKNFLLTKEQSYSRKIKEAILSFRITQAFSKERILELYLNEIYLGASSYGVAAAALNYFNKSINELSVEEAAMLAGLPKAPGRDNPHRNYNGALKRRNYVIKRMYENNLISYDEYKAATDTPITLQKRDAADIINASYFSEHVRRTIIKNYDENTLYKDGLTIFTTLNAKLQKYAEMALQEGLIQYDKRHGWRGPIKKLTLPKEITPDSPEAWLEPLNTITIISKPDNWHKAIVLETNDPHAVIGLDNGTTGKIKLRHLSWARKHLSDNAKGPRPETLTDVLHKGDVIFAKPLNEHPGFYALRQIPKINGAIIAMDPHTGRILAMGGGFTDNSQFNRATQAKRQPGSAFKPFVYLTALENGFSPTDIIIDAEIEFDQGYDLPDWKPQNYSGDFYGPSTLRLGIERSRNAMTVRLAQILGLNKVIEVYKRFNINDNPPRNYSIVLGSAETSLLNITNAYAILANGGKEVSASVIERIQNRNGHTIYKRDARECPKCNLKKQTLFNTSNIDIPPVIEDTRPQLTDPLSTYQIVSMMEGVIQRGTGTSAKHLGLTLAGKTGTTNSSIDNWFIGFSPNLVVGVYTGFDSPKTLGKNETGATTALPIFIQFMKEALDKKTDVPFRIPPEIELVRVNKETGLLPSPNSSASTTILEAFKPGEAPTTYTEQPTQPNTAPIQDKRHPITPSIGTRGIY